MDPYRLRLSARVQANTWMSRGGLSLELHISHGQPLCDLASGFSIRFFIFYSW